MGMLLKSLGELIWDNKLKIFIAIIIISILITILKKLNKIRQKKKELRQAASDRARDENLNSYILNKHSAAGNKEVYVPYEVDYSNASQNDANNRTVYMDTKAVMVQLVERTGLSERKFALNATKGIKIGTSSDNDISLISDDRIEYRCEIFAIGNKVYTKNLISGSRIFIRRKRQQAIVDMRGIQVKSGDVLVVGTCTYTVTIVH